MGFVGTFTEAPGGPHDTDGNPEEANKASFLGTFVEGRNGPHQNTAPPAPDTTPPVIVSAVVPSNGLTIALTYNEALDTGSIPSAGAYSLSGTSRTVSSVGISGSVVTLTLSGAIVLGATVTVSYTPGGSPVRDVALNNAASLSSQAVTNNSTSDQTAPVLSTAAIPSDGLTLTLTYGETLDAASVPSAGAFSLSGTPSTVSSVNVSGSTVVLTLSAAVVQGATVTLNYTPGGAPIQDVAGNDAASLSSRAVTNNSTVVAPALNISQQLTVDSTPTTLGILAITQSIVVEGAGSTGGADVTPPTRSSVATNTAGTKIIITCSETLDTGSVPAVGDFALAGTLLAAITATAVVGATIELTVSPAIASDETGITLGYTAGSNPIQDVAGNDLANFSTVAVTNSSTHAYVPTDDPDLAAWSNVFDPAAFTESGGTLLTIKNLVSGNNATLGTFPAYSATGMTGSRPCLTFNGTSNALGWTDSAVLTAMSNSHEFEVIIVAELIRADFTEYLFSCGPATGTNNFGSTQVGKSANPGAGSHIFQATTDAGVTTTPVSTESPTATLQVLDYFTSGTAVGAEKNGTALTFASPAFAIGTLTPTRWGDGCRWDSTPDGFTQMNWGERLFFSKKLTAPRRARAVAFLRSASRWNF